MKPPAELVDPSTGRKFRADGLFCWHRVHGFSTWDEFENQTPLSECEPIEQYANSKSVTITNKAVKF